MSDGAPKERVLSPHLQIWRFTPTMAASITHRATGMALYGGVTLIALWFIGLALAPQMAATLTGIFRSPIGVIVIIGFVWSLCFHLMNGLRHLYWDSGRGLDPKTATMTAWLVYGVSAVLASVILFFGYGSA